jgi:hypothetical protein
MEPCIMLPVLQFDDGIVPKSRYSSALIQIHSRIIALDPEPHTMDADLKHCFTLHKCDSTVGKY